MKNKKLALWLLLWTPIFIGAQTYGPVVNRPIQGSGGGGSSLTLSSIKDTKYCADAGANDTYTCTITTVPAAYVSGMEITLLANTANTGTATINVNSLGAKTITRADGSTLVTGDITATSPVLLEYDGTNFRMLSTPAFIATNVTGTSGATSLTGTLSTTGNISAIAAADVNTSVTLGETSTAGTVIQNDAAFNYTRFFVRAASINTEWLNVNYNGTDAKLLGKAWTIESVGGALIRSPTYASGSDVALTLQGSLSGNILNLKNSAGTTLSYFTSAGAYAAPSGSHASPAITIGTSGMGLYEGGSGEMFFKNANNANPILGLSGVGGPSIIMPTGVTFGFSSSASPSWNTVDTQIGREAAAIVQLGADVNGAAVNQTLKAHDGITGTNISGANLTIAAGRGTGAGSGGSLIFQTAPVLTSGTTSQTLTTVLTLPKSGGIQVATGTKPTCDSSTRGTLYYVAGGAGVADTYEVCRKDAGDTYAWTAIY